MGLSVEKVASPLFVTKVSGNHTTIAFSHLLLPRIVSLETPARLQARKIKQGGAVQLPENPSARPAGGGRGGGQYRAW